MRSGGLEIRGPWAPRGVTGTRAVGSSTVTRRRSTYPPAIKLRSYLIADLIAEIRRRRAVERARWMAAQAIQRRAAAVKAANRSTGPVYSPQPGAARRAAFGESSQARAVHRG